MGLMKKAATALGFGEGIKAMPLGDDPPPDEHQVAASLSVPQQEFELPINLKIALMSADSVASPADMGLWASRSSADGRLGTLLSSSLRNLGVMLDSPGASSTGTPPGPSCTGGGHGEAAPSVSGHNPRLCTPTLRQSNPNMHFSTACTATATPLARHVATRALRNAGDSAPVTLPSITNFTGASRIRDATILPIQVPNCADGGSGSSGSSPAGPSPPLSPPSTSPRPPPLSSSNNSFHHSPRMRRSTTLETHADCDGYQYFAVSAAAAGVVRSPSAISAPISDLPPSGGSWQQPFTHSHSRERFSRLTSFHLHNLPSGVRDQDGDTGDSDIPLSGSANAAGNDMSSSVGARSDPAPPIRMESAPQATFPATAAAAISAVPYSATSPIRSTTAPLANISRAVALHPQSHSSSPQLAQRAHVPTPYAQQQQHFPQSPFSTGPQGRLPPRRVSDYNMHPMTHDPSLPKLKSVATAIGSTSASAAVLVSPKVLEPPSGAAPPPSASTSASAPAPSALTAVVEDGASPMVRLKSMRSAKSMLSVSARSTGDGIGSSSETNSRSGSAKLASNSSSGPSSGLLVASTSPIGGATVAAAATVANVVEAEAEAETEVVLPTKRSVDQTHPHPPNAPLSNRSRSQRHVELHHLPPRECAKTPRSGCSSTSTSSSVCTASQASAADSFPGSSVSLQPSQSSTMTEAQAPSPPGSPYGSSPLAPLRPSMVTAAGPAHSHSVSIRSPLDEFVSRPTPSQGLLFFSPTAPVQMLRSADSWGISDYKILRKLYAGYASSVYKASCLLSGCDAVLKAYNLTGLSTFLRNQVLRELDIHSRLGHPGIVHLMAAFREGDLLLLVLEYVRGGSLDRVRRKLGGRMTEFQAMHLVLLPLLGVLSHLHKRGIIHRDIKPENLLFTENWQLKLCDFGVSICLREERAVTRTGSREYMAPEVNICPLKRGPEDNKDNLELAYTAAVDVWSLGSLMYELLVGFTPFPGGPPPRKSGAKGTAGVALAFPSGVSQPAREFVRSCLELDPADRPTIPQLTQHPWILAALEYNASLQAKRVTP